MARENTTDRSLQNRKKAFEERRERERLEAVTWAMSDPKGRLLLYDMIFNRCGLLDLYRAIDGGIQRHEGKREVGHEYYKELQRNHPRGTILMISERQRDQETQIEAEAAENEIEGEDNG